MRLDAHQHFWLFESQQYGWMQPDWPIRRDFMPSDLQPLLVDCGLDGCIAVQARQSIEESQWLLELARRNSMIRGVVGWADLRCDRVEEQLGPLSEHAKFVGVRHVVQDEADDNFVLGQAFQRGISQLRQFGLTYDLLVFPRQLPAAIELVQQFPDQPFVLDHIAKPAIGEGRLSPWDIQIRLLASFPNVMCKVSGMITEANWRDWKPADFRPYLETVADAFGPERLMFGSDWPVALLAGSYRQVYDLANTFAQSLGQGFAEPFFGRNAAKFYGLVTQ